MSGQISRNQPGDGKRSAIRANTLSRKCDNCGQRVHRDNGVEAKTGEFRCVECFNAWFEGVQA